MEYLYLQEVDSTNKYARENLKTLEDRTVVYTSKQTAGRGRLQRNWNYMGEDNIYASIVLKPGSIMKEAYSNLTQYLCVILSEIFEEYGLEPKIKWPNDIQINGKKISGILAEGVLEKNMLTGLILGFGVNLNADQSKLAEINQPATSLNIETGLKIDKENFLEKLTKKFFLLYDKFIEEGFLLIKDDYIRRAGFLNKTITVKVFDKEITGFALGVTDNGALRLVENNKEQILLIGDIL